MCKQKILFIISLALLAPILFYAHSNALNGPTCSVGFLCQYNVNTYQSTNGYDQPYIASSSPTTLSANNTINLTVGFNSAAGTSQDIITWVNIPSTAGILSSVQANGGEGNLNKCFNVVANPGPGPSGSLDPSAPYPLYGSPYWNPGWRTSAGGTAMCDTPSDWSTFPASGTTSSDGSSALWYKAGQVGSSSTRYQLTLTPNPNITSTQTICLRVHVSVVNGVTSNAGPSDLRNIMGIMGAGTGSVNPLCYTITPVTTKPPNGGNPYPGYSDSETCTTTSVVDGGWQPNQPESTLQSLYNSQGQPQGNLTLSTDGWAQSSPGVYETPSSPPKAGEYTYTVARVYDGDSASGSPIATSSNIGGPGGASGSVSYTPGTPDITITITHYVILEAHQRNSDGSAIYMDFSYDNPPPGEVYHRTCYQAQCTLSVPGDVPNGVSGAVIANQGFDANATIASTGDLNLPSSLGGVSLGLTNSGSPNLPYSDGQADIPWPTASTLNFNAPGSGTANLSVYPDYYGYASVGSPCTASVKIYQPFTIDPNAATPTFVGDAEDPTAVKYNVSIANTQGSPPLQNTVRDSVSGDFFYTPAKSSSQNVLDSSPTTDYDLGSQTILNGTYTMPLDGNGHPIVAGGDSYCTSITYGFTQGYVGPGSSSDLLDTSGGGTTNSKPCAVVVNKPYFKVYGSGVSSGGSFPLASRPPDGLLADWNNDSGVYPYDFGGGSELANVSTGNIIGYASAQQNSVDQRSPLDLGFANTQAGLISTDAYTPGLGGQYNSSLPPLLDESALPNPTAWSSANQSSPSTGNYTATSNTTIGPMSIANGQSVYLNVTGNVYINGPITYASPSDGSWNTTNVPVFVLDVTGGNIYIAPGVGELDGLYIAEPGTGGTGGTIYTCGQANYTPMSASSLFDGCHQQLTVYGSFEAQSVNLMRTYGSLRDETPVAASTTTTTTYSPGSQIGIVWSDGDGKTDISGMNCTPINPTGLDSYTWNDNNLCTPSGSPYHFCWGDEATASPCTGCNLQFIKAGGTPYDPYLQSNWNNWAICGYPQSGSNANNYWISEGSPSSTAKVLSNHLDGANGQMYPGVYSDSTAVPQSSTGSYCTLMYEDSDPTTAAGGTLIWEHTYICEPIAAPIPTQHTVITAAHPPSPLSCSNNGGTTSQRPTCAAEVFDFSPEFYLSNLNTSQSAQSASNAIEIYNLPPVL